MNIQMEPQSDTNTTQDEMRYWDSLIYRIFRLEHLQNSNPKHNRCRWLHRSNVAPAPETEREATEREAEDISKMVWI